MICVIKHIQGRAYNVVEKAFALAPGIGYSGPNV